MHGGIPSLHGHALGLRGKALVVGWLQGWLLWETARSYPVSNRANASQLRARLGTLRGPTLAAVPGMHPRGGPTLGHGQSVRGKERRDGM